MKSAGTMGGHRLCVGIAIALGVASQAHAIGLGAIEVKSQLGKPFVAEIPITLSVPNEADDLSVRLASPEAFERVGLERPNDLSANLTFSVGKNARGEPVVRISTPQAMADPYVSFLLEVDWGRGKMVREYTALLDPPRTTAVRRVPIVAPVVQSTPMPTPSVLPKAAPAVVSPTTATPTPSPSAPIASTPAKPGQPAQGSILAVPPAPAPSVATVQTSPQLAPPPPVPPPSLAPPPAVAIPEPSASEPIAAAPEPAPVAAVPETASSAASEPPPVTPAPEPEVATAPTPAKPDVYTVAHGDTLAGIATGLHAEVSLNRMMIALQRANPDAFIQQNINLLKTGSVLRIQVAEETQTLSADEANLLVQQQVESWRSSAQPSMQSQSTAEPDASAPPSKPSAQASAEAKPRQAVAKNPSSAKPRVAASESATAAVSTSANPSAVVKPAVARVTHAHLEIIPPTGDGARSNQSGASEGGSGSELRAQLAQTKEDLAARKSEVGELKSRVADLEKMQQDNQSLLSMKDSKLAEMQARLAELEKNAATASTGTTVAAANPTAITAAAAPVAEMPAGTASTPASVASGAPAPATPPDNASKPAPKPVAQPIEPVAETQWYQNPWVLIGGALVLLGGLLGLLLRGRRAPPQEVVRPSRYDTDALAAGMASARAVGEEHTVADEGKGDPDREPTSPPVATPGMPASPAASTPVRRPYWTGAYDGDAKTAAASAGVQAAQPAPASAPSAAAATASSAKGRGDWGFDKPASPTAITAKHRALPVLDDPEQGIATKMELARAYIDIGDTEGARGMLEEVLMEGNDSQREDALKLLETLD